MNGLKRPTSVLSVGYVRSSVLKTPKTWRTRETKIWIAQNFEIVRTIQDRAMWKSTALAFRICMGHDGFHDLSHSYWLSNSSEISRRKKPCEGGVKKKQHLAKNQIWGSLLNQRRWDRVGQRLIRWQLSKLFFDIVFFFNTSKMETHDPNVCPTILGGVSRGFWIPFLDWGARRVVFWHLKTSTFA